MTDTHALQPGIDTSVAHPARRYNYWLGGKDNFAADRQSGDQIAEAFPGIPLAAVANRRFLGRAVRYLAGEAGVRQFLDVGTGLPAPDNTHEVVQAIAADSRIVYVDNDPLVLSHARALMNDCTREGRIAYVDADARKPETVLDAPETGILDLSEPVAVIFGAVLHFVPDNKAALHMVRTIMGAVPAGSYLVFSHAAAGVLPAGMEREVRKALARAEEPFALRTRSGVGRFARGLELVEPGLVSIQRWRAPADQELLADEDLGMYAFVGRKPG